jgi:hypothetical protein
VRLDIEETQLLNAGWNQTKNLQLQGCEQQGAFFYLLGSLYVLALTLFPELLPRNLFPELVPILPIFFPFFLSSPSL